jgi:hypothetical protein
VATVPISSWLPTAGKLIAASFKHPNTDKVIVVSGDRKNVDVRPEQEQEQEQEQVAEPGASSEA